MGATIFWWVTGIGAAAVVVAAVMFGERARLKRTLRKTRRCSIAEFPRRGFGKIVGRVEYEGATMTGPLTGRTCAAFETVLEVMRNEGSWRVLAHETRGVPFRVVDDTGCAVVDPSGGTVSIRYDTESRSNREHPPSPEQVAMLARYSAAAGAERKEFRYREGVIEAGETVAVCGFGVLVADPKAEGSGDAYRGAPLRLAMRSTHRFRIVISDEHETFKYDR